jgi:hypothetical protein
LVDLQLPCDVCHPEEDVAIADDVIRRDLEQAAAHVLQLRQISSDPALARVEALLAEARVRLGEGDFETVRALVKHAEELASHVEKKAQLQAHSLALVDLGIAIFQQHTMPTAPATIVATLLPVNVHTWTPLALETLPTDQFLVELMHRRAPPSDEVALDSEYSIILVKGLPQIVSMYAINGANPFLLAGLNIKEMPDNKDHVVQSGLSFAFYLNSMLNTAFGGKF